MTLQPDYYSVPGTPVMWVSLALLLVCVPFVVVAAYRRSGRIGAALAIVSLGLVGAVGLLLRPRPRAPGPLAPRAPSLEADELRARARMEVSQASSIAEELRADADLEADAIASASDAKALADLLNGRR